MLVDGVGTSLIAKAPYASEPMAAPNPKLGKEPRHSSKNPNQQYVPANARAGSMNQAAGGNNRMEHHITDPYEGE